MRIEQSRIKKYGLSVYEIQKTDISTCYIQQRPNSVFNNSVCKDMSILNSPHYELAKLYFDQGIDYVNKNFHKTKYYIMVNEYLNKGWKGIPHRLIKLFNSIKKGYLIGRNKENYITLLNVPFAKSRYKRDVPLLVPEVFSGHHRIGALLALGINDVNVIIAKDDHPGSCFTNGKIHNVCVEAQKWQS